MKLWENFEKILRKIKRNWEENFKYSRKIMKTLLGKIEVIQNWCCWYYEEILENFSEIISVKLGESKKKSLKNFEKI